MHLDVVFCEDSIHFPPHHLTRAGVPGDGTIGPALIRDADPQATPPEIRTHQGQTLLISANQGARLEDFCRAHVIRVRPRRPDVWGDLLGPFLVPVAPRDEAAALARLRRTGLTTIDVGRIRDRVGPLMSAYNAFFQDDFHLGLADLLNAAACSESTAHLRSGLGPHAEFYAWAMKIADLGACT
ncbi:hypothetical protein JK359_35840 [Streptomyces actinomycinicus]|uniref:Uncharacterized protein n=1 Tax=Streptomyces actinomycinicus TaxID=1695166 RepID=A0A937ERL1_9ACTN|nr:hypothetical protein [Streptomyces actinomycinicus]MBL1087272.1 hypothetical protein [Streptomyces actinomycinicus]